MTAISPRDTVFSRLAGRFQKRWMMPPSGWRYAVLAGGLILLAGLINLDTRDSQWQRWQADPARHFVSASPLVTTTDAGFFLSHAEDLQHQRFDFDQHRNWPDNRDKPPPSGSPLETPLLSVLISNLADLFFAGDLLVAGNRLIPYTALLTAIAIGLGFWAAGFAIEGAIAGLGTCMSVSYLVRTSIGRIDTDQLILFFTSLVIAGILLASRQRDWRRGLLLIIATGLVFHVFRWWYDQALFLVLFPLLVLFSSLFAQQRLRPALLYMAAFILVLNPLQVLLSVEPVMLEAGRRLGLIAEAAPSAIPALVFPDTYKTITELADIDLLRILANLTGSLWLGMIGLFGFLVWALLFPSQGIVFLPFLAMGLLGSIAGQRFSFYAAPMLWFGIGWLVLSVIRLGQQLATRDKSAEQPAADGFGRHLPVAATAFAVIFGVSVFQLGIAESRGLKSPQPSFPAEIISGFSALRELDGERGGVIATWWDYGYFVHFKTGLPTLHDPGAQRGPRTWLIARGMVDPRPELLVNTVRFLAEEGTSGIEQHGTSLASLDAAIAATADAPVGPRPVYLVITGQMTGWLRAMATLGLHNPETGLAPPPALLNEFGYMPLRCRQTGEETLDCNGRLFNLRLGTVDGRPVLSRLVQTENGFGRQNRDYGRPGRYTLLLEKTANGRSLLYMVPHRLWISSFNQLYNLGLYDNRRLKLVLDNYPAVRVYEVLR